ncbi:hypothetical protein EB796_008055 [Bugula neritina]|uniref:Uncharacterized protein n=1 Tax=Bugula neritina TaxID=10212 RepID=A0A7J7K6T4_BUGNE|nr:hypothetical protein EB796_008055 [Bugula neritina]
MDSFTNKSAEETGGVHKLAILKQILHAKLADKRGEELKKRSEILKMEALEEEMPEDEVLDDDYEFSDEEEEEDGEGSDTPQPEEELGPILNAEHSSTKSQLAADSEVMKRVKAVLDSDGEDESRSADLKLADESNQLNSLAVPSDVEGTIQQENDTMPSSSSSVTLTGFSRKVEVEDDNARDPNSMFGFTRHDSAPPTKCAEGILSFHQGMFNTQQAEDEAVALCSGQFDSQPGSKDGENTEPDVTSSVKLVKKQPLYFSDEEEETRSLAPSGGEEEGADDELDQLDSQSDSDDVEEPEQLTALHQDTSVKRELVLHKVKQTKREKLMGEYLDREAELSGEEAGSDEDLDLGEEGDQLELEQGDLDYLGKEEELRSQIAKTHV